MEQFKDWDTMRDDNFKIGDWAIYAAGTAINANYAYVGYVTSVGEYSVSLRLTLQIDKYHNFETSAVQGMITTNLRRYQLKKLSMSKGLKKAADRQIIHLLQLDAVRRNDEKRFYELGEKLNGKAE